MEIYKTPLERLNIAMFNRNFFTRNVPCHVTDVRQGCPCDLWSNEYLLQKLRTKMVNTNFSEEGIYNYNPDDDTPPALTLTMPFQKALTLICSDKGKSYYIQQQSIPEKFKSLMGDIECPPLLDSWKIVGAINFWFGGEQCRTPLHFDFNDNFLLQVRGTKRIQLYPPSATPYLYRANENAFTHNSHVNVFNVDNDKYPLFHLANDQKAEVVLNPGEFLYIPKGWWHAVESCTVAISVNFWWKSLT